MFPILFATITSLGLTGENTSAQSAQALAPPLSQPEPTATQKLLAEPTPEPEYAYKGELIPTANPLANFRSPGYGSMQAGGFRGGVFATPLPGRSVVPEGSRLVAPVITPARMKHGHIGYDVIPAGRVDAVDPIATRHPEDFMCGDVCGPAPYRVWGSAEFLLGTTRAPIVPPLVTTGPASLGLTTGGLGNTGTVPLFGGRMLDDWRSGFRGELGVWLDDARVWGVSGRFYSLFSTSEQFVGGGDGPEVIALPRTIVFRRIVFDLPISIAFPGLPSGTVVATAETNFAGGDVSLRRMLCQGARWRLDGFAGYRQLHLGDELGVEFRSATGAAIFFPPADNTTQLGSDSLRTRNNFFGGQLGGIASGTLGRFTLEAYGAVALGTNASELNNDRSRQDIIDDTVFTPEQTSVKKLTHYFGTVWEGGLRVAFRVTDNVRLTMGYTGLSWWNVRRAQEQYDFGPDAIVTGSTTNIRTDFFAHMISWGAELRY